MQSELGTRKFQVCFSPEILMPDRLMVAQNIDGGERRKLIAQPESFPTPGQLAVMVLEFSDKDGDVLSAGVAKRNCHCRIETGVVSRGLA